MEMSLYDTISKSVSVTLDSRNQTLSELTVSPGSPLENGPEREHAGEALIKIEIIAPVKMRDQESNHGWQVFIIMFIIISVILLYFVIQTYM